MSKKHPPTRRTCNHRCIVPGTTYLITKKTRDDLLLICPSGAVNQVLLYLLIERAQRYGVQIHGYCFLSNHFHLVITDVLGRLPAFMRDFQSESSKALRIVLKESRPIWSRERYSPVKLLDADAAERKVAYTVLNPARAGLTNVQDWPGLNSGQHEFGETLTAKRPDVYFSKRYRPEQVSIALEPLPQAFYELTAQEKSEANAVSIARIKTLVKDELDVIHADLIRRGKRLAGPERVKRTSRQKRGSHPVRTRNPRFATRNRELMKSAIAETRKFEEEHERARQRYVAGSHKTVFPHGTYGYRELLGVRVAKRRIAV